MSFAKMPRPQFSVLSTDRLVWLHNCSSVSEAWHVHDSLAGRTPSAKRGSRRVWTNITFVIYVTVVIRTRSLRIQIIIYHYDMHYITKCMYYVLKAGIL